MLNYFLCSPSGCAIADFNLNLMSKWEKKSGEFEAVKVASNWDKRTYNSIVVEGDDQKWVLTHPLKQVWAGAFCESYGLY